MNKLLEIVDCSSQYMEWHRTTPCFHFDCNILPIYTDKEIRADTIYFRFYDKIYSVLF